MGTVSYVNPVRRSLTAVVTAVLVTLTLAAGAFFAFSATRGTSDPRPSLQAHLDRLALPDGAVLLTERVTGGVACEEEGCPTVERWWDVAAPPAEVCSIAQARIAEWGGIRFQRLASTPCGFIGVLGPNRLAFSVEEVHRARLPRGVIPPEVTPRGQQSVLHVSLTRN